MRRRRHPQLLVKKKVQARPKKHARAQLQQHLGDLNTSKEYGVLAVGSRDLGPDSQLFPVGRIYITAPLYGIYPSMHPQLLPHSAQLAAGIYPSMHPQLLPHSAQLVASIYPSMHPQLLPHSAQLVALMLSTRVSLRIPPGLTMNLGYMRTRGLMTGPWHKMPRDAVLPWISDLALSRK